MRYARSIFAFVALSLIPSYADLSWEYTDQRKAQAEEARAHQHKIEKRERERQPSPEEQAAYAELGKALAEHPEMAAVNLAEANAITEFQKAQQSGTELELSLASQKLAKVKAERFQKAASIPELMALIVAWQKTSFTPPTPKEAAEVKKNTESINKKLEDLLEQMKR